MIPDNITREHILEALRWLDKETPDGARPGRQSTKYDLVYEGKRYAPKEAIAIANRFANGRDLNSGFSGGNETNKFLRDRGFQVVLKPGVQKEGIPDNITREHILEALRWLDKETPDGARPRRQSTKYDLLYEGKRYDPKEAIAIANKFANGRELNSGFGDDKETNKFLNARGFQIVLKPGIQNKS